MPATWRLLWVSAPRTVCWPLPGGWPSTALWRNHVEPSANAHIRAPSARLRDRAGREAPTVSSFRRPSLRYHFDGPCPPPPAWRLPYAYDALVPHALTMERSTRKHHRYGECNLNAALAALCRSSWWKARVTGWSVGEAARPWFVGTGVGMPTTRRFECDARFSPGRSRYDLAHR